MRDPILQRLDPGVDVTITLDFETYWDSEYTLKKLTTEAYVRDRRFEVIGVGVRVGDGKTVWLEEWQFRVWAARVNWRRVTLVAHHAQFDCFILSERYGIKPGLIICTMSVARALHGLSGVSLDAMATKYGIGKKGAGVQETRGKRRRDFTPAEYKAFGDYCINDVDLAALLLPRLLAEFPTLEIHAQDRTVRMFTEPVLEANRGVLTTALNEELRRKRETLEKVARLLNPGLEQPTEQDRAEAREALASAQKFADLLRAAGVQPQMKPGARGPIPALAKDDPGMQALLDHPRPEIRELAAARLEISSRIVETRTGRLIDIARRGRVPIYLKYCGAHTHRWSGGDKMTPQNFNRGGALRAAIEAPPGHSLVVVDSGQIEARVVAWFAGQRELLETFRRNDASGGDFYSDEGSRYFRRTLSKKDTPKERQVAKSMVLGLGFGMGWKKFALELLKGMLGADPIQFGEAEATSFGVDTGAFEAEFGNVVQDLITTFGLRLSFAALLVHCAVTFHFVNLYRKANGKIAASWRAMDQVIAAMATPGPARAVKMRIGCLQVMHEGIRKPNGLVLRYPGLKRTSSGYIYTGGDSGREVKHIYGALLVENIVQSIARDIVAEQALRIAAEGYALGMMAHDEVMSVVADAQAERCLARSKRHLRLPPWWCRDLPLNASGGIAKNYAEAK